MSFRSLSELARADINSMREYVEEGGTHRQSFNDLSRNRPAHNYNYSHPHAYPYSRTATLASTGMANSDTHAASRDNYRTSGDNDIGYSYEDLVQLDDNVVTVGLTRDQQYKLRRQAMKFSAYLNTKKNSKKHKDGHDLKACHVCMENYTDSDIVIGLPCGMYACAQASLFFFPLVLLEVHIDIQISD